MCCQCYNNFKKSAVKLEKLNGIGRIFCLIPYVSEKKSPKELLSPQIIFFFIEGSPVDDPTDLQNRSTMGVQIPSTFPKSLDFKPFQPKARFLGKL